MARTWLSIRVDLIEGHGEQYWPRPGRIFAAARSHTFKQLADAIDDAFAAGTARTCRSSRSPTAGACAIRTRTGRSRARSPRTTGE
jgi:hypothetical protein